MRVNLSKLALGLTAGLLVLSAGGMAAVAAAVNGARDQVVLTERVLAGDVSAAEGLTAELRTTLDHYLFWNTRHTFGQTGTTQTDYDFTSFQRQEPYRETAAGVELSTTLAMGFSFASSGAEVDGSGSEMPGLLGAYNRLYLETPNGEERSQVITLSDYYDYYPITGSIRLPGCTLRIEWEDAHQTEQPDRADAQYVAWRLQEYFKIPMLEGIQMEISIQKSGDGRSVGVGGSTTPNGVEAQEYYSASTRSVLTDDACYFTLNALTTWGNVVDVSQIEGGFGVYRLPFGDEDTPCPIDALEMVYPLDPTVSVEELVLSADGSQLLLFAREGGQVWLTVIDLATMTQVQRLAVADLTSGTGSGIYGWSFYDGGDFWVGCVEFTRWVLIAADGDGRYGVRLEVDVSDETLTDLFPYLQYDTVMAWDGARLAAASYQVSRAGGDTCGFSLAVFDAGGLQYLAAYDSSLNAPSEPREYADRCRPMDEDGMMLYWYGE